ncbi:MAG: hypothetical protein ACYDH9_12400 [Limisphaerales bacterium]
MRTRFDFGRRLLLLLPLLLLGFFGSGCLTTPKVDWNSRIGSFSYDQAVIDLGPPDKYAKLTDGTIVAEWLTYRGSRHGTFYNFSGLAFGQIDEPPAADYYLRLTFAPDSKLQSWKRVVH